MCLAGMLAKQHHNRRLLLWWSQQKKDVNDANVPYMTIANPAMAPGGGGMALAGLLPPPGSATVRSCMC